MQENLENSYANPVTTGEVMLEVSGLNKRFGEVQALTDAKFVCYKGEAHALVGENGAGKSTLVKILCGALKPDSGEIRINGEVVQIESPYDAVQKGIAAVFQELSLVPDLSVAENIFLAHEIVGKFGLIDRKVMEAKTAELFKEYGFHIDPQAIVSELPLATKQLVEIAKVLSKKPEIIIFDEATSALSKEGVDLLFKIIRRLVEEKKTIIFISHRMDELGEIVQRATVYRDSKFIESFKWGAVTNDQIVSWIAGRDIDSSFPDRAKCEGEGFALEVKGLSVGTALKNIDLCARKGEIIGIAGLNGHGQIPFLSALYGAIPFDKGEIILNGKKINPRNPRAALREGIVLVPSERKTEGILLPMSVRHNLSLMILSRISSKLGFLKRKKETKEIGGMVDKMSIKAANIDQPCSSLSGGNQQKVVIGKALLTGADLILFADPTRGVDVGTKTEIYKLINELANAGITILYYSTELIELVGLSNRVVVFKQGEIAGELSGEEISEHKIINYALGIK